MTLRFQPTRGDRVDAFRQLLGIPSKGLRLGNALVVDRDDTGLSFAVGHKQAAPLRLLVSAPEDSRPAFVKTRRFAMSYSVGERELTCEERALIDDLAARLRAADGV